MGKNTRAANAAARGSGAGVDVYQTAVSKRIWVGFAILAGLLVVTALGMIQARSELANVREEQRRAESKADEAAALLKSAQADKQAIMNELATQGALIAQSSRDEEKARSEIDDWASKVEVEKKRSAKLAAEVKTLKGRLAKASKAKGGADQAVAKAKKETAAVREELNHTRARLQDAVAEMERLRTIAEPYRTTPAQGAQ